MSYDRLDGHVESALEAGQPPEHGFTHIGLYLGWLIRHDLHDPAFFPITHVEAVKAGEMTGSDLTDDIDGKLVGLVMTAEGRAFSDARYEAYMAAYAAAFADAEPYAIADDDAAWARIEPILDGLYADWVADVRPATAAAGPSGSSGSAAHAQQPAASDRLRAVVDQVTDDVRPWPGGSSRPPGARPIEALVPVDLADPPMEWESAGADAWDSSLLRRALKRLGVRPADARVVSGMGGRGEETLAVLLFEVPGVDRARLVDEFRFVIYAAGRPWQTRFVGGRVVEWITIPEFSTAFWANDGLVVQVSGRADLVEAAIARLP